MPAQARGPFGSRAKVRRDAHRAGGLHEGGKPHTTPMTKTHHIDPPPNTRAAGGFAVGYGAQKGRFRVYIMAALSALFLAVFLGGGGAVALILAALTGATAYYFYPLTETAKPRLGANQYGIFIDGFGVIAWRAIGDVLIRTYAMRSIEIKELHIELSQPLSRALTSDWRRPPLYRLLMRLPWTMTSDNVVHVNLEPFAGTPDEILQAIQLIRKRYG